MPLPEWTLDTSFAEKLQQLRHAVDHLLGDDTLPMFKDPPPEEVERRQREAGTFIEPSAATPEEVRRAAAILEAYNRQQSQPLGASPSQPQQLQPADQQSPLTPSAVQSGGIGDNPPENAPTAQGGPVPPPPPARQGPAPEINPNPWQGPDPAGGRQAWNPNPLPPNTEGSNR
jgi:hypothetical protein